MFFKNRRIKFKNDLILWLKNQEVKKIPLKKCCIILNILNRKTLLNYNNQHKLIQGIRIRHKKHIMSIIFHKTLIKLLITKTL